MSFSAVIKQTTQLCRGRVCALLLGRAGRAAASLQPSPGSARCQPILWGWQWKEVLQENDFTSCEPIPILDFKFSTLSPEWNARDWAVCKQCCYGVTTFLFKLNYLDGDLLPQPASFEVTWRIFWLLAGALPIDNISFPPSIPLQ